jgi:type VI secretion system secreted protein Hcp
MAYDAFLKIEGIEGESQDKEHKGEIEIDSFSWGVTNTVSSGAGGGGGGAGKAVPQDFHFTAPLSKASPNLMLACCTGRHFKSATLTCRKAGFEFEKVRLEDVIVSSYQTGGNTEEGDRPEDQFSLNFEKIDFLYTVQRTGETVETTFDFGANKQG